MGVPVDDFATLMALEPHGPDVFVGTSPDYDWGRVYGGQVVAQGLWAATSTVDADHHVHSVHAYFIRGGSSDEPIRYEVDRIRNGRSFITRRVVARQSEGAILNLACSFQVAEEQADVQESAMPDDGGDPGSGVNEDWGLLERRLVQRGDGRASVWLRLPSAEGGDPALHACALAYASDDIPTTSVAGSHPRIGEVGRGEIPYGDLFVGASLDHTIWFHRPLPPDQWLLHDHRSHGLANARGLAVGEVFAPGGAHVATVAQEVLIRERTR